MMTRGCYHLHLPGDKRLICWDRRSGQAILDRESLENCRASLEQWEIPGFGVCC